MSELITASFMKMDNVTGYPLSRQDVFMGTVVHLCHVDHLVGKERVCEREIRAFVITSGFLTFQSGAHDAFSAVEQIEYFCRTHESMEQDAFMPAFVSSRS